MKKIFLLLILIFPAFIKLFALDFNKVSEFCFSESREQYGNIAIQDNKLFVVGVRGLEIYEIGVDSLSLLMEYNIEGESTHLSLKGNYAYVSTYSTTSRLYRIDISDIYNPIIKDTLYYLGNYANFIDGEYIFVNELLDTGTWKMHVYENDTFQEIVTFDVPHVYYTMGPVASGVGFVKDNSDIVYLYDLSVPDSIYCFGSGYIGESSTPCKAAIIQDTIFIIASVLTNVKMYDISNSQNWELLSELDHDISDFCIQNNIIILRGSYDIWLYDITDANNPVLLDHTSDNTNFYNSFTGITADNYRVFVTKYFNDQINYYDIENNFLNKYFTYSSSSMLRSLYIYNDDLYISTWQNGIQRWNIADPNSPFFVQEYFDEYVMPYFLSGESDIMAISMIDKTTLESFLSPLFIESSGDLTAFDMVEYPSVETFYYREDVGFFTAYNSTLFKYELDDSNQLIEVCTLDIPISYGNIYFLNNYPNIAYILGYSSFVIIDNANTNDSIEVVNEHTAYFYEQNEAAEYLDYLFMTPFYHGGGCIVYDISDPLHPTASFMINKSGSVAVDEENDLLFIGDLTCTVYDLSNISEGHVDSLCTFRNWSFVEQLVPFKQYGTNYLLYLEKTSVSIYEYTVYNINEPNPSQDNIISSPNPFSTSTTINFNLTTNSHELSQIKIYNIKGQLVRTLPISSFPNPSLGMQELVWDGKDGSGNDVKSGVYFYKIDNDDEHVGKVVKLK